MTGQLVSNSLIETELAGERLGRSVQPGDIVGLLGELGSGKTAFVRGVARGIGIAECVTSPTFALVHEYPGATPLLHLDVWRLTDADEILSYIEPASRSAAVTVVEWSDRLSADLFQPDVTIEFKQGVEADARILRMAARTSRGTVLLNGAFGAR